MNSLDLLHARASLLKTVRSFFDEEGVLEVETPLLFPSASPEPYLNHLSLTLNQKLYFLQSSPEFAMKQLLAACPVSMFQICKAFRGDEQGSKHSIEFSMLEWYMRDYDLQQLMQQCERLLGTVLKFKTIQKTSYRNAFIEALGINPFDTTLQALQQVLARETSAVNIASFSKDECLHLLFAEKIEPSFHSETLVFIYDFPETQAALAQLAQDEHGQTVARRFEIFFAGVELANAYQEENNIARLKQRFDTENQLRQTLNKEQIPVDDVLLKSWQTLPACSGIAMGLDRLLMLQLGKTKLKEINFFL